MRILHDLAGAGDCRFSPHCWRAKMALMHKGLEFETSPVPFTGILKILDGSHKTVPVLEDDNMVVSDSFQIALHLEEAYPDRPTLFGGPGGVAAARFVEQWANTMVNAAIVKLIAADIHGRLTPEDQAYFRESRERRFGASLEALAQGREAKVENIRTALTPARRTLEMQPFLGGEGPLFTDYILFGTLQWVRVTSDLEIVETGDTIARWFEACLDLYDGLGRSMEPAGQAA
ncbi:glutathione S-transferase family protein [Lutibaculum baratangense]|uniref:Putative beta-etherase n=1 Tax=Lutibaculum baratangense AMV1 TaxID=631454 RepID=V4R5J4_9HYPH|nr:glutathione S-transferase family protein [Lutibaculum baratangense]ESR27217.1 putative beta-etherase [Lutibaculum baratangense AMV1]